MRYVELIMENYTEELEMSLNDLLAAAKGRGLDQVSTDFLVKQMNNLGYEVNQNSIMTLLQDNPFVVSATPDTVDLDNEDSAGVMGGEEDAGVDSEDKVDQMAQQGIS